MHFSILYILLIISIVYNCHFLCIRSICCVCLCNWKVEHLAIFTAISLLFFIHYLNFYAPFIMLSIFYLHFSLLYNYVICVPICTLFKLYIITISCMYSTMLKHIMVNSVFVVLCLECGCRRRRPTTRRCDPEFLSYALIYPFRVFRTWHVWLHGKDLELYGNAAACRKKQTMSDCKIYLMLPCI